MNKSKIIRVFVNTQNLKTKITDNKVTWLTKKKDLKIPDNVSICPHKFRHTYASTCLNNGADIFHVLKLLGHTSLRMTQRYTHKKKNILKNEHERYSPMTIL